ncbi:MAG: PKD domain-containing protein [Labilibaculum sp.]|nr:PKD domain-containing protein [Labilibaculum sp.]MBI9059298.1 PKD domain-containing protein [Labilibaculum sp.]
MKNILYFILLLTVVVSCSPDEYSAQENLMAEQIEWGYNATDVTNEYTLYNNTPGVSSIWDFGNGVTQKGNTVTARYTFAGTYTVTLTVISQGGVTVVEDKITTDVDNPSFLSGYPYDELIGSGEQTWAIDAYSKAHFGLGPTIANPVEWYGAAVNDKADRSLYDDRFTFKITASGLTVTQVTNGLVYANGAWASDFGTTAGNEEPSGGDFIMPFDGGDFVCTVAGNILNVTGGGFLGYYAGASEYEIMTLTEDLLEVAFWDTKSNFYWFTRFRPVDKLTPEPEPVVKELESNDISDDFEGNGNVVWETKDIEGFDIIDNFAPSDVNSSEKIVKYQKGAGEWTNVLTVLDYKIDLSTRNQFTMKVFIPAFNDYVTECNPGTDWLAEHNLKPQVDVKLQDSSLGGNAWQTQQVRSHTLTADQFGQWVELTFDYSDVTDRVDFDQVVIQLGAEGHCNTGLFYIDDFKLLP